MFAGNVGEVPVNHLWAPLLAVWAVQVICIAIFRLLVGNWASASLLSTISVLLFCSYGHLMRGLGPVQFLGLEPFRHRTLVPLLLVGLFFGVWRLRRQPLLQASAGRLSIVAGVLVGASLFQAAWNSFHIPAGHSSQVNSHLSTPSPPSSLPDIVVLVLDEFPRPDRYHQDFNGDLSGFVQSLEKLGFVVARGSHANYPRTIWSLASFLNLDYIPGVSAGEVVGPKEQLTCIGYIRTNLSMRFLRQLGYKIRSYTSSFVATQGMENLDEEVDSTPFFGEFAAVLVRNSGFTILQEKLGWTLLDPELAHRQRVLFMLSDIPQRLAQDQKPTFTFIHCPAPHEPFVFHSDGSLIRRKEKEKLGMKQEFYASSPEAQERLYAEYFPQQCEYIAKEVLPILESILNRPGRKPIVVVVSDHGSWLSLLRLPHADRALARAEVVRERYPNLTAIAMPGLKPGELDGISLVNVLRLVFSRALGCQLPPLPDRFFWMGWAPAPLEDVTEFLIPPGNKHGQS